MRCIYWRQETAGMDHSKLSRPANAGALTARPVTRIHGNATLR